MSRLVKEALAARQRADDAIECALRIDYPVGARIAWELRGVHEGTVTRHGYRDRIQVKNGGTGREYWIRASAII